MNLWKHHRELCLSLEKRRVDVVQEKEALDKKSV
jgi:hypothetical protein